MWGGVSTSNGKEAYIDVAVIYFGQESNCSRGQKIMEAQEKKQLAWLVPLLVLLLKL